MQTFYRLSFIFFSSYLFYFAAYFLFPSLVCYCTYFLKLCYFAAFFPVWISQKMEERFHSMKTKAKLQSCKNKRAYTFGNILVFTCFLKLFYFAACFSLDGGKIPFYARSCTWRQRPSHNIAKIKGPTLLGIFWFLFFWLNVTKCNSQCVKFS